MHGSESTSDKTLDKALDTLSEEPKVAVDDSTSTDEHVDLTDVVGSIDDDMELFEESDESFTEKPPESNSGGDLDDGFDDFIDDEIAQGNSSQDTTQEIPSDGFDDFIDDDVAVDKSEPETTPDIPGDDFDELLDDDVSDGKSEPETPPDIPGDDFDELLDDDVADGKSEPETPPDIPGDDFDELLDDDVSDGKSEPETPPEIPGDDFDELLDDDVADGKSEPETTPYVLGDDFDDLLDDDISDDKSESEKPPENSGDDFDDFLEDEVADNSSEPEVAPDIPGDDFDDVLAESDDDILYGQKDESKDELEDDGEVDSSLEDDILSEGSSIDEMLDDDSLSEFRGDDDDDELGYPDVSGSELDDDEVNDWDVIHESSPELSPESHSELDSSFGLDDSILKDPDSYSKEVDEKVSSATVENESSKSNDGSKVPDDDSSEVVTSSKKPAAKGKRSSALLLSGVAAILSLSIGSAFYFGPTYLDGYIKNQENVVRMEQRIIELESKVKKQGRSVSAKLESDVAELNEKLNIATKRNKAENAINAESLKSDMADFENNMLDRVGKVVLIANSVAAQQAKQGEQIDKTAQSIKEQLLREVAPLVKSEIKNSNLDKAKLDESISMQKNTERKLAQLQAKYSAQRELISLMEGELGYVKERMNSNTYGVSKESPSSDYRESPEPVKVLVDSVKEPDGIVLAKETKPKNAKKEKPSLSLSGVFSGPGGRYDIYVDVSGKGMSSVRPYLFTPNQVSEIPGYGKIISVRKIKGSSARVPYVVETEGGLILGKK